MWAPHERWGPCCVVLCENALHAGDSSFATDEDAQHTVTKWCLTFQNSALVQRTRTRATLWPMKLVPTPAVLKKAAELGVDVEALRRDCEAKNKSFISVRDVEPFARSIEGSNENAKTAAAPVREAAPVRAAAISDPLFLHGNTIETVWKRGRTLVGKVYFRANASRPRIGKRRGRTKYLIVFEGRKVDGARTSWNRLKAHGYCVIASPREVAKSKAWSDADEKALRRRHGAGESYRSLACSLGRTSTAISLRLSRLNNKAFAPSAQRCWSKMDRSIRWREVVAQALKQLGGRGAAHSIRNEIEQMGILREHHYNTAPGLQDPMWHCLVSNALSARKNEEFEKTAEKQKSTGKRSMTSVWAYHPDRAPIEPVEWPDGKPRERKYKRMNAKEKKKGYDGVPMKI